MMEQKVIVYPMVWNSRQNQITKFVITYFLFTYSGGEDFVIPSIRTSITLNTSDSNNGINTCVSGSPNRQLNSRTLIPSLVNINPAYKTPA